MNILDLGDDVQWRILLMNADMDVFTHHGSLYEPAKGSAHFRYSPLTITMRTAQVCRFWRRLLLGSPSIWGRVIDLDFLDQRSDTWRNEVLRRTGKAPLCIKGEIMGVMMEDFFLSLIDEEWPRIRRISVRIHNEWDAEDDVWSPLTRPTSVLESFNLCLSGDDSFPSRHKKKLFGNNAPSLVEFYPNNIKFNLLAPWVLQLRYLEVSHPFTVKEILEVLRDMTSIETISLGRGVKLVPHIDMEDFPQVFSPRLGNIVLTCMLETATQFIQHITPKEGCGLSLTATDMLPFTDNEFENPCRIIARYADAYFKVYPSTWLLLNITQRFLYLHDLLDPSRPPSSPTLKITIDTGGENPSKPLLFKLLSSISPSMTSGITTLDLLLDSNSVDPSDIDFLQVMYNFKSLETLHIGSLDTLAQVQQLPRFKSLLFPDLEVIFPSLKTLVLVQSAQISADLLKSFLVWRRLVGAPVKVLDLTFSSTDVFGDLRFLDKFDQLRVIWSSQMRMEEYICGSGQPSRIDFRICRSNSRTILLHTRTRIMG